MVTSFYNYHVVVKSCATNDLVMSRRMLGEREKYLERCRFRDVEE